MKQIGCYGYFSFYGKTFILAATPNGLCYMNLFDRFTEDFQSFTKRWFPHFIWNHDEEELKIYIDEFVQYFEGTRKTFTFPIDLKGTEFQLKTWNVLRQIPYGQVISYSDVAKKLENPLAVRAVGGALKANPLLICNPCHRVVGKDGSLTGFRAGLEMKKELLRIEKIK